MSHTIDELRYRQALPLDMKVAMTKTRIREWIRYYGEDGVYVSFSGGKDSAVLLRIARQEYPNLKAMFVDVPTQYPELRQFVKKFDNVDIVRPKMNFMQVCEKYGFPLFSKEIAQAVSEVRTAIKNGKEPPKYRMDKFNGVHVDPKTGKLSHYNMPQYKFLLEAPFDVSHRCCFVMKKQPAHEYSRKTGRVPILAQMADESRLRQQLWIKNGCNAFDTKVPASNPMSFWTEQDVLRYIKENDMEICPVYGDVIEDDLGKQISMFDDEIVKPLKCTGCQRTGCVLCGFGAHMRDDYRFIDLKQTHPGMYGLLDVVKNNGYTMRQAIDWINANSDKMIKY